MENSKEQGKKKIKDEDLGTLSGGCGKKDPHKDERYRTLMECSECGQAEWWKGNYEDGIDYLCPRCGKLSYRGVRRRKSREM